MKTIRFLPVALLLSVCAATPASARRLAVHPGESIRAAIARALPGDQIEVLPGVYKEGAPGDLNALTITKDRLELVGRSTPENPVVLQNAGGQSFGVWISPANSAGPGPEDNDEKPPCGFDGSLIHGFSIRGFTLRGFQKHGLHLACVDGFHITHNVSQDNAVYGLFPVVSRNGFLTHNVVRGTALDAGIYVGQSDSVVIAENRAENNLIGLEVENSRHCSVLSNELTNNTIGILVDILPFLVKKTQDATLVAYNQVRDNNRVNTGSPGDITAVIPSGTGILILGGHAATVMLNKIENNGFAGVAVASLCLGLALEGLPCTGLDIDPDPSANRIVLNELENNGTIRQPDPSFDALRADLVWDGSGTTNCWSENRFTTSTPPALPSCHPAAYRTRAPESE
jgi:parallel beta-helix repeat protein